MNIEILIAFLIGMIILAATPGPGVFASVARALSEGFKSSLFFIGGLVIGVIIFFLLAILGMSTISKVMGHFSYIIRIIGGGYLIYLGIQMIKNKSLGQLQQNIQGTKSKSFAGGFLVTMGNPKPILFYASIVPTIIDINQINPLEMGVIIAIIISVSFIVIGTYCYLAVLSKTFITNNQTHSKLNIVSGMIMMTAGSFILLKRS